MPAQLEAYKKGHVSKVKENRQHQSFLAASPTIQNTAPTQTTLPNTSTTTTTQSNQTFKMSSAALYDSALLSTPPACLRPVAEIEAALAVKREHLRRACEGALARFQDGELEGRRRRRREALVRLIERFLRQEEALEMELLRAKALEWWIEDQWRRLEAADSYQHPMSD